MISLRRTMLVVFAASLIVSGVAGMCAAQSALEPPKKTNGRGMYRPQGLDRGELTDKRVIDAISRVPRHLFVLRGYEEKAYHDRALPIEEGQTISQPFIVALMTQEAEIEPGAKVLEIGTGSGYQAAVLAELGAKVFTIEIVPALARSAKKKLQELGYESVEVREGDGWQGWPEQAPFDAILVTAASPRPPEELLKQLKEGGRLIAPIEEGILQGEKLVLFEKRRESFIQHDLGDVRFVPLKGKARKE